MVTRRKNVIAGDFQAPGQFRQRSALVVGGVAESGVNVVPDDDEVRNRSTVFVQIIVNNVCIAIVSGNETKGRIGIFIDARMEATRYPVNDFRQVGSDFCEQIGMPLSASSVPF